MGKQLCNFNGEQSRMKVLVLNSAENHRKPNSVVPPGLNYKCGLMLRVYLLY